MSVSYLIFLFLCVSLIGHTVSAHCGALAVSNGLGCIPNLTPTFPTGYVYPDVVELPLPPFAADDGGSVLTSQEVARAVHSLGVTQLALTNWGNDPVGYTFAGEGAPSGSFKTTTRGFEDRGWLEGWDAVFRNGQIGRRLYFVHRIDSWIVSRYTDDYGHTEEFEITQTACVLVVESTEDGKVFAVVYNPGRDEWRKDMVELYIKTTFPHVMLARFQLSSESASLKGVPQPSPRDTTGNGVVVGLLATMLANPTNRHEEVWDEYILLLKRHPTLADQWRTWAKSVPLSSGPCGWDKFTNGVKTMTWFVILVLLVTTL